MPTISFVQYHNRLLTVTCSSWLYLHPAQCSPKTLLYQKWPYHPFVPSIDGTVKNRKKRASKILFVQMVFDIR